MIRRLEISLNIQMSKHASWLKEESEQAAEMMAENSQQKWSMVSQHQKKICEYDGTDSTPQVSSSYQESTEPLGHSHCVEKRVADSHKPVIGHHC